MTNQELAQVLMAAFLEELHDHVAAINNNVLALEKSPDPQERQTLLKNLFRAAHTIKGSAQAANIELMHRAAHRLEDVLAPIRDGRSDFTPELFALMYQAADAFEEAGMRLREQRDLSGSPLMELIPKIEQAANPQSSAAKPAATPPQTTQNVGGSDRSNKPATIEPASSTPRDNPEPSLAPPAARGAVATAATTTTVVEQSHAAIGATSVRVAAEKLDTLLAQCGELLVSRRRIESQLTDVIELRDLASEWSAVWRSVDRPLRQMLRKRERAVARSIDLGSGTTLDPTEVIGGFPRQAWSILQQTGDRIRQFEKSLDQLAMRVRSDGRQLGHSCDSLEDEVYRVRMLPFSEACVGLERAVRDVALASGKQVQLVIDGAEVEVDRSVLEGLKAPLLHLVRNAVDHGVESPADRQATKKPEMATITVSAALRGAVIEVTVADDGRGIDLARIREVAANRGFDVPTDEHDLLRLLFQPGFTTAREVTRVSGRGVGLDVVQSQIEGLHGNVDVASVPILGTRFTLRVPLTLTTIHAVLLQVNDDVFAVPTSAVRQIIRFENSDLATISGRRCLLSKSSPIPTASLAELLDCPEKPRSDRPMSAKGDSAAPKSLGIVLHSGTETALFTIDQVIAEQEIVVKSLGSRVRRLHRVSAATLLPSGRIALLLNVPHLLRLALGQRVRHEPDVNKAMPVARRKRLLVVDDSMTTRMLIKTILEGADYEVVTAVDGESAWALLPQQSFDLVVSDVDMPRMNGFDLTATIRGAKPFAQLPVVLVTARETEADKARGLEVGANGYVTKGAFDQRALLEVISRLI